jgi:hypothetical protein
LRRAPFNPPALAGFAELDPACHMIEKSAAGSEAVRLRQAVIMDE